MIVNNRVKWYSWIVVQHDIIQWYLKDIEFNDI